MNYSPSPYLVPPAPAPTAAVPAAPVSVPAKRKRSHTAAAAAPPATTTAPVPPARNHANYNNIPYAPPPFPPPTPSSIRVPAVPASASGSAAVAAQGAPAGGSDDIHCICGYSHDDGLSIACDDCGRWSHMICFDILPGHDPEEWRCWECAPREVDRRRAARRQHERALAQKQGVPPAGGGGQGQARRRRERRTSINTNTHTGDEHVDIEDDWRGGYVPLADDAVPHATTRAKLRLAAQNWRGVTALAADPESGRTRVVPLAHAKDDVAAAVRPPSYALQTTAPIAGEALITPYTSTIIPSAAYLADPLNAYAHMGMPKPHVHLVPPPLSVALDARMAGNEARFARSGCRPNAVLRPVLCRGKKKGSKARASESTSETEDDETGVGGSSGDDDPGVLKFALFALRDLKACEEVVLSWEWDDGAVVHQLPALIE
ncbi:hypothetical protein DFH11DRAFT_1517619, partial [Phellopilus nigrolimitatus]